MGALPSISSVATIIVTVAVLLVAPTPLSVELIGPVVLFLTPAAAPVTATETVQLELAARFEPETAVITPLPQDP